MSRAALVELAIEQNTGLNFAIVWRDCNGDVVNPYSYTPVMKIRATKEATAVIATLSGITTTTRMILFDVPASDLNLDFHRAWYSLRLTKTGSQPIRLMEGPIVNNKEVSD